MTDLAQFTDHTERCLREWSAFVDLMHDAARDTDGASRYQLLEMIGALRIRIASGTARLNQMKTAQDEFRSSLRVEIEECVALLRKTAYEGHVNCQRRLGRDSCSTINHLIEAMPNLLPSCGNNASPR